MYVKNVINHKHTYEASNEVNSRRASISQWEKFSSFNHSTIQRYQTNKHFERRCARCECVCVFRSVESGSYTGGDDPACVSVHVYLQLWKRDNHSRDLYVWVNIKQANVFPSCVCVDVLYLISWAIKFEFFFSRRHFNGDFRKMALPVIKRR